MDLKTLMTSFYSSNIQSKKNMLQITCVFTELVGQSRENDVWDMRWDKLERVLNIY